MALALHTDDDLLVAADVLGSFGVTPADVSRDRSDTDGLETALADALANGVDRTTVVRRTVARSDRGLTCAARYSPAELERELAAVFDAIDWSLAASTADERLRLTATDPAGRSRETTVDYPETPLATDNLPAVLWSVNESVLAGTDARFVLCSAGVDRWRAALVDGSELERLREEYGPRIDAFDRPLLPEHGLAAYVPGATANDATRPSDDGAEGDDGPWPPWALEREPRRSAGSPAGIGSIIDEAEPATSSGSQSGSEPQSGSETDSSGATAAPPSSGPSASATEIDGFELAGTPTVSRTRDEDGRAVNRDSADSSSGDGSSRDDRSADTAATDAAGFGQLSGTSQTARVDNDAFGAGIECRTEDDRYRALGAALDAGGTVSVRGLLEDDDFLPELPAADPEAVRIEYPDGCDPVDPPEATAAAEEAGFEWVDASDLETTRVTER